MYLGLLYLTAFGAAVTSAQKLFFIWRLKREEKGLPIQPLGNYSCLIMVPVAVIILGLFGAQSDDVDIMTIGCVLLGQNQCLPHYSPSLHLLHHL